MKQLNWATLGCGVIANELAQALSKEGRTLYSVANRTHEKAQAFAQKYGISKVYDNIDDVFEYYGAAEPPVRCGESHLSGLTEPPHFVY